eukprot:Phypoly_transcript_05369.p2 GENE.Phypoly_transcript_05369~~Phypoly_transcript_05369.p2  ORF type:complete len:241 (+),score=31.32 Phypoly_transcript_05369:266-988(+)
MVDQQSGETILRELKVHGILMVLIVMVLMTSAMLLSRYLKPFFNRWFYVHAAVFIASIICMIVSVILVFRANNNVFYTSAHTVLGLMFVSGMGLQTLLGLLAHFLFNPKRSGPPAFPDQIHWWLGRFLLVVGGLAVTLGMRDLGVHQMSWISFYLWGITIFIAILYLERYIGQTHETATHQSAHDGAYVAVVEDEHGHMHKTKHVRIAAPVIVYKVVLSAGFVVLLLFIVVVVGIGKVNA